MGRHNFLSLGGVIVLMLPFLQLGESYYVSCLFLLFLYALLRSSAALNNAMVLPILVVVAAFAVRAAIGSVTSSELRDTLLPLREALCFVAIISIAEYIAKEQDATSFVVKCSLWMLVAMLGVEIYQTYSIANGSYWGFPIDYFVANGETLMGVDEALKFQTRFRPTSFYGEPSYTSFIALSLFVIAQTRSQTRRQQLWALLLALLVVGVSQSIAGVLAVLIVGLYSIFLVRRKGGNAAMLLLPAFLFLVFSLVVLGYGDEVLTRLGDIVAGNDESVGRRFAEPLSLLESSLGSGSYFGVNSDFFLNYAAGASVDNAALRLLCYYGVLIVVPMFVLLRYSGGGVATLYLLLSLNFNGEVFSFDKVVVIGLVLGMMRRETRWRVAVVRNVERIPLCIR